MHQKVFPGTQKPSIWQLHDLLTHHNCKHTDSSCFKIATPFKVYGEIPFECKIRVYLEDAIGYKQENHIPLFKKT